MPRTKPKEHARRTRTLRRRELTKKLVEAAQLKVAVENNAEAKK